MLSQEVIHEMKSINLLTVKNGDSSSGGLLLICVAATEKTQP